MINLVEGDVTAFSGGFIDNPKILAHITNNYGGWGAGVVVAISKKWPEPEEVYRKTLPILGDVHFVKVFKKHLVANMCAQDGYTKNDHPACNLASLKTCLQKVRLLAEQYNDCEVHMPKIGAGLGGRDFDTEIFPVIEEVFRDTDVEVYIYTFKE